MTVSNALPKMPRMNEQTIEKIVETTEKRDDAPKAPLFVRHLQSPKVRSGVRGGIVNKA